MIIISKIIHNLLRYPFNVAKKVYWASEPSSFFGLTDHPLDKCGGPINDIFTFARKFTCRKAASVLQVEFKERVGSSFSFKAKGYDIYRIRDMREEAGGHEYLTKGKKYSVCPQTSGAEGLRLIQGG